MAARQITWRDLTTDEYNAPGAGRIGTWTLGELQREVRDHPWLGRLG